MPRLDEPSWVSDDEYEYQSFCRTRGIDEDAASWLLFEERRESFCDPDDERPEAPDFPDDFDEEAVIPWV